MKTKHHRRRTLALGLIALVVGASGFRDMTARAASVDVERREAAKARQKDPAWKPATAETGVIQIGDSKKPGALRNFCLDADGNILACIGSAIRVYAPDGKLVKTLRTEIAPSAVAVAPDRTILVGGEGRVLRLDPAGKVLASGAAPSAREAVKISKDMEEMIQDLAKQSGTTVKKQTAAFKKMLEQRRAEVTGLAATGDDVYLAIGAPNDFSYRVYRFSRDLATATLVADKLRGCCGQMDIQAQQGRLWISHNAKHCVESRDRDGKELTKFGSPGKVKASDFGGCCEPKNLRVLANGDILAAESGPPTCIKRFSADGSFKEVIAVLDASSGDCVRVTVEMSPDGGRFYLLDTAHDAIRVFAAKN